MCASPWCGNVVLRVTSTVAEPGTRSLAGLGIMNSMVTRWGKVVLQGQGLEEHLTPCLGKKPDLVLFAHVPVIFSSRIFKWLFFIVSFLCHVVIYIFGQCILRCFILLKQIFYLFFLICLFEGERYV